MCPFCAPTNAMEKGEIRRSASGQSKAAEIKRLRLCKEHRMTKEKGGMDF